MSKILDKIVGEGVGAVIPGGKVYYKALSTGINWLNKVVKRKKDKAEQQKSQAEARIAQLKSLNFQGLQNAGVDTPYSPAQAAVFGRQESQTTPAPPTRELVSFETLDKDGNPTTTTTTKSNGMEWIKKNWYYVAGGAAVLYYLMKKKGR